MDQLHSTQLLKSGHRIMPAQMDVAAYVARFADNVRGDLAERYGYVNRSLPDSELDAFVDALARRIASFDKGAIADTKRLVDVASLPSDAEISLEWDAFLASLSRPASQLRIKALMERGFHRPGDVEDRLGYHVGQLGS
jgi:enoyl-CoA hydratase/carnithine racemase